MGIFNSNVLKTGTIFSGFTGIILLAACAPYEPKEPPPLTLADVDFATRGVVNIVGQFSTADLNKDPRIVCEKRTPTGSNIAKMYCLTEQERRDIRLSDQRILQEFIDEYERKYFRRADIK
jgi:hypothetical protein